jgi:PST family polysaccharide transporter
MAQSPFDTEHLKSDIKQRSLRGGAATMLGEGVRFVIRIVSTMVLARLLVPADFGLVAMVTAVTGFAGLLGDIGLSMATIQKAEINHQQISTLFWINAGMGALVGLVTAALAPLIAWFYGEPRLTMITVALAGLFLVGGVTVQHAALLKRQMRFVTLQSIQVVSALAGVGAAILCAWMGAGYWALVVMQAASTLAQGVGVWLVCGWRPGLPRTRSGVRSMLVFGGNITAFNVVNYFARNVDHILIGRFWGPEPLGLYNKAYGLLMMPLKQINMPLHSVVIPALSRLRDDLAHYRSYYLKTAFLITLVSTPVIGWFIVCSEDLILVMLGPQWLPASDIFSVLGIAALVQPLYFTQGWLHMSAGRSDRYLRWGLVASGLTVLGFLIGVPYGPIGVAASYAVVSWAIIAPCMWYAGHSAGISARDIFGAVYKNLLAGIGSIVAAILLIEHTLELKGAWANLLWGFLIVGLAYCLLLLSLYRSLSPLRELLTIARAFTKGSHTADDRSTPSNRAG